MARKSLTRHEVLVAESGGASGDICLEVHCTAKRCRAASTSFVGEAMTWWRKEKNTTNPWSRDQRNFLLFIPTVSRGTSPCVAL